MHFGMSSSERGHAMQSNEIIEDIVMREFKALCDTCAHQGDCVYHQTSTKAIIQCELFEYEEEQIIGSAAALGLCITCDLANECTLPGRKVGTWHCNEFR
jgi:hypothetical protein